MLQEEKIQSSPFHEVAEKLLEKGIISIPLVFADKRPVPHGWQNFTKENIKYYLANFHDTSNVGVVLGKASGLIALDFDNNVAGLHNKILNLCGRNTVVKKGNNGGTLFFRYNGEKPKKWKAEGQMVLELLSDGNQTVIPPSIHPKSQKPYVYTKGDLLVTPLEEIPFLPANFLLEVDKLFGIDNDLYSGTTLDQVKDALNFLEPSNYDDWLAVGMALKNDFETEGFEVWNDWSAKGDNYVEKEMQYKWKSFNKGGLTCATIFKKAIEKGFKPVKNQSLLPIYNPNNFVANIEKLKNDAKTIGVSAGIPPLDKMWHIRKKEVTLISGAPNSGKSEFADYLTYKLVTNHNYKALIFSFEKSCENHLNDFIHKHTKTNMFLRSNADNLAAVDFFKDKIVFTNVFKESKHINDLLTHAKDIYKKWKFDILYIDPYSYIKTGLEGEKDRANLVSKSLSKFAADHNVHVLFVAHPRTLPSENVKKEGGETKRTYVKMTAYEVSGGATWYNDVENIVIVHNRDNEVTIDLQKVRNRKGADSIGEYACRLNILTGHYETIKTDY